MTIANVVDKRKNKYDTNAWFVIEPSWHDNSIDGATQFPRDKHLDDWGVYYFPEKISIYEAFNVINEQHPIEAVTVFIYDRDPSEARTMEDWKNAR